mgnify:CR=1 FL=1
MTATAPEPLLIRGARLLDSAAGTLAKGMPADLCLFHLRTRLVSAHEPSNIAVPTLGQIQPGPGIPGGGN